MLRRAMMAGGPTLYEEIMADSPWLYMRLGEASGTTAQNEVASRPEGTYSGSISLGNAAIYTGGPTCYSPSANTGRAVYVPGGSEASSSNMTLVMVYKPSSVTGVHQLLSRDTSSGGTRYYQWRTNGANLEFVKITGGVDTKAVAHGMTAGVACILHVRVTSDGVVTFFRNGASLGGGTMAAASYLTNGSSGFYVGNRGGVNEAVTGDKFSEAAAFAGALSDARILAHAKAAGLA